MGQHLSIGHIFLPGRFMLAEGASVPTKRADGTSDEVAKGCS